jgi:O-antigen/teichoic acid export membrane protein
MKISRFTLLTSAISTLGTYGAMQLARLMSGIIMARLLTPDLLGIMLIVYVLRYSAEQLSDIGIGQSIVSNSNAEKEEFFNTAWSLQLIRGILLTIAFLAAVIPLSYVYDTPIFTSILPIVSLYFVLAGFTSMSLFLLARRMQIIRLNIFELCVEIISAVARVGIVYIYPTIWGLVFGSFVQPIARLFGSHFIASDVRHKFYVSKDYAWQIFDFGKWIFFSAVLFFLSSNFDRLYLGKVLPFALLGIFGIARNLSGTVAEGIVRVCRIVVFPLIATSSEHPLENVREEVAPVRLGFLILAAIGVSVFVAVSDILISILYDARYQEAGWMLPVLSVGLWFSTLSSVNEWTLIGIGRAQYSSFANGLKFAWILVALPLATIRFGMLGTVFAVALSDLFRYFPILLGQIRFRLSFAGQDLVSTLTFIALIVLWEWLRAVLGLGTSFSHVPFSML